MIWAVDHKSVDFEMQEFQNVSPVRRAGFVGKMSCSYDWNYATAQATKYTAMDPTKALPVTDDTGSQGNSYAMEWLTNTDDALFTQGVLSNTNFGNAWIPDQTWSRLVDGW